MAADKLVDSTQLDADLTTVANAIRAKGGTSADLAFPADFISAINAISGGGGGIKVKKGTFTIESDTTAQNSPIPSVEHGLGEVPRLVLIWTEDYSQESPPSAGLIGGYIMSKDLLGDLKTRLTSSATASWNMYLPILINTTPAVNTAVPTSTTYWPSASTRVPTSTHFYLTYTGSSNYWRAGVTYKYLVVGDWT